MSAKSARVKKLALLAMFTAIGAVQEDATGPQ